jgi:phosphoribosylformimino-5-aminoimidazole carboxamide ribotide isomerase
VIVYPAIDIRGGRCVRLIEGDFARETAFDDDPADAARRWATAGAEWIHVVDLDAAVAGTPVNTEAMIRILDAVDVPVQLGGGMRTRDDVAAALAFGVSRVVIGTKAIADHAFVAALIDEHGGDRVAVGLDARDGKLAGSGWLEQTDTRAVDVASTLAGQGVRLFVYTDIRRDGTLAGPNLAALSEMIGIAGEGVIASGGIGSIDDIERVRTIGAGGVIIGRALYDGRVNLDEAIRLSAHEVPSR